MFSERYARSTQAFIVGIMLVIGSFVTFQWPKDGHRQLLPIEQALAARSLDASAILQDLLAVNPTDQQFADGLRYLYTYVLGQNKYYTATNLPKGSDSSSGLVGVLNDFFGLNAVGGVLRAQGYGSCSGLPTTGSVTSGLYTLTFTNPSGTVTIPSHFTSDAGQSFSSAMQVSVSGVQKATIQFKCSTSVKTIYLRYGSDSNRSFEIYSQHNDSTNANEVDFFMTSTADSASVGTEKLAFRVTTSDGTAFKLYVLRTVTGGSSQTVNGLYYGAYGNSLTGRTQISVVKTTTPQTNTTNIDSAAYSECVNLHSSAVALTSGCSSNTNPSASSLINGSAFTWNLQSVYDLTLTNLF